MPSVVRTAGRLGQELGRVALDLLPSSSALPGRAADFTPPVMSSLLGREVSGCEPIGGTTGTTDRSVLRLRGDDVPDTVFVKSAATDLGTRLFGGLARLGEVEVGFFRDLRAGLDLEAPAALGSRFERRTGRFAVVLEDLAARGAEFVDTTTPLSADQVAAGLSTLAALHGSTSGRAGLPTWLGTNSADALMPVVSGVIGRLGRKVAERDPSLVAAGGDGLLRSYGRWAEVLDRDAFCVLHGDPHPGNVYLLGEPGDQHVGLLDWQAVRRGNGFRDATYFTVLSLEAAVRREHERELLAHYCGELAAAGGPEVGADAAWTTYRQMVAYVYVATTFTSGLGGLQGTEIADTGLRRAVAAVEDLDTPAALSR
ncbi:aminoglycoside phosphotransferase (APT) family kinase protein [Marmoricola sp. OAE513]|uniref:phosphotransferase n=1 Tax=Marmoricola sp. OAE513 TaxID=2817894 RepID=UPI001AE70DD6